MANPFYVRQTNFVPSTRARSGDVDGELDAVVLGFDKLTVFGSEAQGATVNDYEVTLAAPRTSNAQGDEIVFEATHTNTGPATLKVDSIAAVPIVRSNGSACSGGELVNGLFYALRYDASGARFQLMTPDPPLASDVTQVQGTSTDDPTSPGTFNASLPWRNDSSELLGSLGYATGIDFELRNVVHGGNVVLSAEDAAGVLRTLLTADPDAQRVTVDRDLYVSSDLAGATASPNLRLVRDKGSSGSANDELGQLNLVGMNNAGTPEEISYAQFRGQIVSAVDGSETGRAYIRTHYSGTLASRWFFEGDGTFTMWGMAAAGSSPDAVQVPNLSLFRNSIPATGGDTFSSMSFDALNSAGTKKTFALLHAAALQDLAGSEDGQLRASVMKNGSLASMWTTDENGFALPQLTATRAIYLDANKRIVVSAVTPTELGYLSGVTSAIQTQLNAKAASSHSHSTSEVTDLLSGAHTWAALQTFQISGSTKFRAGRAETTADFGTGADVVDGIGTLRPTGFNVMPIYEIDAADSFDLAHNGMMWHKDTAGAVTFTCANDGNIPVGATYVVTNEGAGDVTIAASGVTLRWFNGAGTPSTGNRTLAHGGICTVFKYTDTEFWVWGVGLS